MMEDELTPNELDRLRSLDSRVRVLESEARSSAIREAERFSELRAAVERIEGRLWLLVTSAAGIGAAVGTGAASMFHG